LLTLRKQGFQSSWAVVGTFLHTKYFSLD